MYTKSCKNWLIFDLIYSKKGARFYWDTMYTSTASTDWHLNTKNTSWSILLHSNSLHLHFSFHFVMLKLALYCHMSSVFQMDFILSLMFVVCFCNKQLHFKMTVTGTLQNSNKAVIDCKLCPWCCHLESYFKHTSFLLLYLHGHCVS